MSEVIGTREFTEEVILERSSLWTKNYLTRNLLP